MKIIISTFCFLLLFSCKSSQTTQIDVLHVRPGFHSPQHGTGLIELEEEIRYSASVESTDPKLAVSSLDFYTIIDLHLIKEIEYILDGKGKELSADWYDELLRKNGWPKLEDYYADIEPEKLAKVLKSHCVDIEYRLTFLSKNKKVMKSCYLGTWGDTDIPDILLYDEKYYSVPKNIFSRIDALLLPFSRDYYPFD